MICQPQAPSDLFCLFLFYLFCLLHWHTRVKYCSRPSICPQVNLRLRHVVTPPCVGPTCLQCKTNLASSPRNAGNGNRLLGPALRSEEGTTSQEDMCAVSEGPQLYTLRARLQRNLLGAKNVSYNFLPWPASRVYVRKHPRFVRHSWLLLLLDLVAIRGTICCTTSRCLSRGKQSLLTAKKLPDVLQCHGHHDTRMDVVNRCGRTESITQC